MNTRHKEKIKSIVNQSAEIIRHYNCDESGKMCVIGALLNTAGVKKDDLLRHKNDPIASLPAAWKRILHERFGLKEDQARRLQEINDKTPDTWDRRQFLIEELETLVRAGEEVYA